MTPAAPTEASDGPFDYATGLSSRQVVAQQTIDGPNRLPRSRDRSLWHHLGLALAQPMVLLLLASAMLYGLLGAPGDAAILGSSVLVVIGISTLQAQRRETVLAALRDLASPRSTVRRDGRSQRISSLELVTGDVLLVEAGDRLACDAQLVEAHGLLVDESLLTGESQPVAKQAGASCEGRLLCGTLVVQGLGTATVTATGRRSSLARMSHEVASVRPPRSKLQQELQSLVQRVALAALGLCLLVTLGLVWNGSPWVSALLLALTMAMAIVPEEFAIVWTVMLTAGAWRLAKGQVLARQVQALEALGKTTALCVDKTGTLTCNRMSLVALHDGETAQAADRFPRSAAATTLLETAAWASSADSADAMDAAILAMATPGRSPPGTLLLQRGVQAGHPWLEQHWQLPSGQLAAIKGAPEAVLSRTTASPDQRSAWQAQVEAWGGLGWRVIAVAQGTAATGGHEAPAWKALGLLAFADPLRPEVPAALQACRAAGVRTWMITGDAAVTALAVAQAAGLAPEAMLKRAATGADMARLDDSALQALLAETAVFARMAPADKLRLVRALQAQGEVVAMTGDGVNDASALRAADIGVAMGQRGTDVAREAADLILLNDRFASLVEAMAAGRRIFSNLQHALGYLFAVHVPIVALSLWPLAGGPVLLHPVHIAMLELLIDPVCSLVFEAEPAAADAMQQPPRPADTPLMSGRAMAAAFAAGALALLPLTIALGVGRAEGWSVETLRAIALAGLVAGNLALLGASLRRRGDLRQPTQEGRNPLLLPLGLVLVIATVVVVMSGSVRSILGLPSGSLGGQP